MLLSVWISHELAFYEPFIHSFVTALGYYNNLGHTIPYWRIVAKGGSVVESVQNFLIKLDIKPLMHLLEISIFSLNVRLTKIMNNLVKDIKILSFKVIFKCLKLVESFKKKSVKNIWLEDQLILIKFFENFDF